MKYEYLASVPTISADMHRILTGKPRALSAAERMRLRRQIARACEAIKRKRIEIYDSGENDEP